MLSQRRPISSLLRLSLVCVLFGAASSCIRFNQVEVQGVSVARQRAPSVVTSPVKAHLSDGATILYPRGVVIEADTVRGDGFRYAAGSSISAPSSFVVLDSVVGMETYQTTVRQAPTILATTAVDVLGFAGSVALFKIIFGSCPTFYSDSAGVSVLEAEGFSYSIAPLFEQRDVDRLRAAPTLDGNITLQVRNEALETHYLNQIQLIEALHSNDEYVVPDQGGRPIALSELHAATSARDRAGRDVASTIAEADGVVFRTDSATMAGAQASDLDDYIDLTIPRVPGIDSVAVVLRMRNSLLNTVLLYERLLGDPGAKSLDWVGQSLQQITGAIDVGRWYTKRMGMRISVRDGAEYRSVGRIGDSGPIAFHDLAFMVPVPSGGVDDSVHVRLSFIVDDWRIDQIRVATQYRRPATRIVSAAAVTARDPSQSANALRDLREADEGYVVTSPGQSFTIRFNVGKQPAAGTRTFLLASQGYYNEWVRGSWIKAASGREFKPTDDALMEAVQRWRAQQPALEREFYSTRIAVR